MKIKKTLLLKVLSALIMLASGVVSPTSCTSCGSSAGSGGLSPPGGWKDSDNALHPYDTPGYYEWWYLDATFDNGYFCGVTLHWRQDVGDYLGPVVEITIRKPDGTQVAVAESFEQSESTASQERCDLVIGNNFLRQNGNDYILSVHTDQASAELTFHGTAPPWKWSGEGLIVDDATGKHGHVIPVPRANVEGKLWIGNEVVDVSGSQGYQDHNWGNVNLSASTNGWGWGRMFSDKFTYVYFWLIPISGAEPTPLLYIAMDERVVLGSTIPAAFPMELTLGNYNVYPESGDSIPNSISIEGKEGNVETSLEINVTEVTEYGSQAVPDTELSRHYYRRLCSFDGANIVAGETYNVSSDNAINEYVLFVP